MIDEASARGKRKQASTNKYRKFNETPKARGSCASKLPYDQFTNSMTTNLSAGWPTPVVVFYVGVSGEVADSKKVGMSVRDLFSPQTTPLIVSRPFNSPLSRTF